MLNKTKLIVICGPTGIGKTSFAIRLSKIIGGEIIGADSMQIYKYMDIGTAKPSPLEKAMVRHHMVDIVEPDEPFDAARYASLSQNVIDDLCSKNIVPVVAGGTGLYIKSLIHGLFRSRPADAVILKRLEHEAETKGGAALHKRLAACDSKSADKIHPNDVFRIIRALEVFESTGQSISQFQESHGFKEDKFDLFQIGLNMDRSLLYERINTRVDMMLEEGFLDEVQILIKKGYHPSLKSMQSLGYRHLCDFLEKKVSWEETIMTLKRDTRRYAKRQLTWFRNQENIFWTEPGDNTDLIDKLSGWLK
jgi:tRNA dimethylallyltransferase